MIGRTRWAAGAAGILAAWLATSAGIAQPPANRPPANRLPANRPPINQPGGNRQTVSRLPPVSPPVGQQFAGQSAPRLNQVPPANQPSGQQPPARQPSAYPPAIAEAIGTVEASLKALETVSDYSCVLVKRERIGGRLSGYEHLSIKLRHEPFSVYVRYLSPDRVRGQEAIYVHGHNENRLLAHPNGLKGRFVRTVRLDPLGKWAMEGNRYPVTDLGVKRMAESWLKEAHRDVKFVHCDAKTMPGAKLDGKPCTCVELTRRQRHREVPYQMTRLFIDPEMQLPVRYEAYEWSSSPSGAPVLAEEYTYRDLEPNLRFADRDFDVGNPEYGFR